MRIFFLAGLLTLGLGGSAQAETISLGYQQDTGPRPYVSFWPSTVERAISFEVTYTSTTGQPLETTHYIKCSRGPESVADEREALVTPPHVVTIPATMASADECWIGTSAGLPCCDDSPGTVRIDATAHRAPAPVAPLPQAYWLMCRPPGWISRGEMKVHGIPCSKANRLARAAWRAPARRGARLRVAGHLCFRTQVRKQVRVRCDRGAKRFRLAGRLRR